MNKAIEPIKINMPRTKQQTKDILVDTMTLLTLNLKRWRSALVNQAPYWMQVARTGFEAGHAKIDGGQIHFARVRQVAELLAAGDIVARLQVRKIAKAEEFAEIMPKEKTPTKAIEWLKNLPTVTADMWSAAMARKGQSAFFITGIEQKSVLVRIQNQIEESLKSGHTLLEFEARVRSQIEDLAISGGHLRTVWHTNVSNSLQTARHDELSQPAVKALLGYYLFDAVLDGVVRPNHAALENGIAPVDWPGWSEYRPLLGFNCRCNRIAIPESRALALIASGQGWDMTKGVPAEAGLDEGFARMN